jgi:hypothetical protein
MTDDEEKQLKLELLAADLSLRRKQEFWETPRNVAILVGVTAAIAAAIGFWLGRESAAPTTPVIRPVTYGDYEMVTSRGELIDIVQTAGIIVIAVMLIVTATRFMRAIDLAAQRVKEALTTQREIHGMTDRLWKRLEAVERNAQERNKILPTPVLAATLNDIQERLERLEEHKHEDPPDNHH